MLYYPAIYVSAAQVSAGIYVPISKYNYLYVGDGSGYHVMACGRCNSNFADGLYSVNPSYGVTFDMTTTTAQSGTTFYYLTFYAKTAGWSTDIIFAETSEQIDDFITEYLT